MKKYVEMKRDRALGLLGRYAKAVASDLYNNSYRLNVNDRYVHLHYALPQLAVNLTELFDMLPDCSEEEIRDAVSKEIYEQYGYGCDYIEVLKTLIVKRSIPVPYTYNPNNILKIALDKIISSMEVDGDGMLHINGGYTSFGRDDTSYRINRKHIAMTIIESLSGEPESVILNTHVKLLGSLNEALTKTTHPKKEELLEIWLFDFLALVEAFKGFDTWFTKDGWQLEFIFDKGDFIVRPVLQ